MARFLCGPEYKDWFIYDEVKYRFCFTGLVYSCVKDAIRQLFSSDSSETSVRLQVCNVICLLVTTIHQIYAVFYAGDGDSSQPGILSVFAICYHPSVCLSSVPLVHPTLTVGIFGNVLRHLVPWPSVGIRGKFYGDRPRGTPPLGH